MAHLNDNFTLRAPVPVDDRKGWWDDATGEWKPFDSVQHALDTVVYYRYRTLTLPVVENGDVVEYWFKEGIEDSDFTLKTSQVDLSNYYTKTELQTSGSAQVHWDNITNVPDLSVTWENITGDQSVIGNAGFSNTANYITLDDVPVPTIPSLQQVTTVGNSTTDSIILSRPVVTTILGDVDSPPVPVNTNVLLSIDSPITFSGSNDSAYMGIFTPARGATGFVMSKNGDSISLGDTSAGLNGVKLVSTSGLVSFWGNSFVFRQVPYSYSGSLLFSGLTDPRTYQYPDKSGTIALVEDIPDLTGYATETWVQSQGYLTSVSSSWDINTGDLTIQGNVLNLDGRYMLRSNTITSGYGIVASADFSGPVSIGVDTEILDSRYLRKDISDSNGNRTLSLGNLNVGTAVITTSMTLGSIGVGEITDELVVRDPSTFKVRLIPMPDFGGTFTVANNAGTPQFTVDSGDILRFNATGDASIAFNAGTKTITINSSGGSSGGGVDSWNARTGAVVPEAGDYNTSLVDENPSALYFTAARVRSTTLTGLSISDSSITATDTVLSALGKAQGQINSLVPESRSITINGTAGNITVSGGTQTLAANRTWTINLANKGTAGTYTKVVTDAQGRVTAGGALTVSDLPPDVMQTLNTGGWAQMGYLGISGGNNIAVGSLSLNRTIVSGTPQDMVDEKWSSSTTSGLMTYSYASGSSGFNGSLGSGIMLSRYSGTVNKTGFIIDRPTTVNDKLYYANIAGDGVLRSWQTFASESWVLDQIPTIPTNYVTTNTNQPNIDGWKAWTGSYHRWTPSATAPALANSIGMGAGSTGAWLQGWDSSGSSSWLLRGYTSPDGVQLQLSEGGINVMPYGTLIQASGNTILNASSANTVLSAVNGGVYLRPVGTTTNQAIFGSTITLAAIAGTGTQMVTVTAAGVLGRAAIPAVGVTSVAISSPAAALNVTGGPITSSGTFTLSFTGTTSQVVRGDGALTNANGHNHTWSQLSGGSTALIPGSGASSPRGSINISGSKASYSGINFVDASHSFVVRNSDGLAGIISNTDTWAWYFDGSGVLTVGTVPWARLSGHVSVTAGNGLSGGGTLAATRTITLGTPSNITLSSTNSVTTSSHTHAFAPGGTTAQYIRGNGTLATFPSIPQGTVTSVGVSAGNGLTGGGTVTTSGTITLNVAVGNGLTVAANSVSLTAINAGSAVVGAVRYNGTTKTTGSWYGGSASPTSTSRLNYDGIIHAYDFVGYGTSDRRLKENIVPIVNPLEKLSQIGGYSFKWKDGHDSYQGNDYGVIAQEVEKVLPEIVSERGGIKAIKTGNQLTGLLIAGFNELVKRVEALENGLS